MEGNKYRDLEERTTQFAIQVIRLCKALPKNRINHRLIDQIVCSSGSVGANYREANESLGKKDFLHRMKISRKECKETDHWLRLIEEANPEFDEKLRSIFQECRELRSIFSAIITKSASKV